MSRWRSVAAVVGALLAGASTQAAADRIDATCTARDTTAAMIGCIAADHARQDRRLNIAYRAAQAALPASRRAALTGAQRAWLAFRDAECRFVADPRGGSRARVAGNDCMRRLTAERADALEALARGARGP